MLIMVFVFGCVDFAKADSDSDISNGSLIVQIKKDAYMQEFIWSPSAKGKFCGVANTSSPQIASLVSLESFNLTQINNVYRYDGGKDSHSTTSFSSYYAGDLYRFSTGSMLDSSIKEFIVSGNFLIFATDKDAYNYLKTGKINNLIYDNRPIEYDETIELPLMAQCQVNGDSFLFNCKQSVAHSDYTIQLSAECRLTPVYSNFASKSYADTKQSYRTNKNEIGKYDNHGVSFNTSFSTSDLLNGVDTSRKALGFKEFYNGIYINLPYEKCTLSEIVFYARNICDNKCSNWVRVTYDLVNETSKYEEIESVTGSNVPSDTKHNNSKYYPDDYLYNDDEAFNSSSNVSNTLTNLKSNYTSLANFYKELFSFLPAEIWIILIGLVSTMVVIAIIKFVRG